MNTNDSSAGATPVAEGATPSQSYPFGPGFARYTLPIRGARGIDPRAVGITFAGEGTGSDSSSGSGDGGAAGSGGNAGTNDTGTGGATGASSSSTDGSSATDDDSKLGEGGKRAIERERELRRQSDEKAKTAQHELEELRKKNLTDSDRAIEDAKAQGKAEVIDRLHQTVRRSAVTTALLEAGAVPSLVSDLVKADEFAGLKVNDEDEIDKDELKKAVKAHKDRVPDAYRTRGENGSADGGSRGGSNSPAKNLDDAIGAHYGG